MPTAEPRIGLVIRSGPFQGRSSRDQLDMALAAASLGQRLLLVFRGAGILQLLAEREPAAAGLPKGLAAWGSLPDLTSLEALVNAAEWAQVGQGDRPLSLAVQAVDDVEIARQLALCDHVLAV
ncbi:MAG: hypothetical protein GTN86_05255 [Xanthomonadales bacterium]|nr:hypothetical protein [Xanthomonadales bacterium]NIN59377.1 hypothetical protein [Xanthomonadales bacterium]NIN74728.1 hypothetical protein [Xanthomonadales bacterium]NIO14864.1 hypothetical protein [Xanthomonadales bacterium]NIP11770.1 hypothetical protein [Xanthomonadales bacterium]